MTDVTSAALPLVRAAYGAVLLCAPGAAIRICAGRPASPAARAMARLLGARHLAQAALTARAPGAAALTIGAQVDLAHAASMLALAMANRPLRRAGLADGMVAAMFAAAGMGDARRAAGHASTGPRSGRVFEVPQGRYGDISRPSR